jgi:hypothetical protein
MPEQKQRPTSICPTDPNEQESMLLNDAPDPETAMIVRLR